MKTKAVIFLNGVFPHRRIINTFSDNKDYIIAADGAANNLKKINIIPDLILGDLDSIKRDVIKYYTNKDVPIIKFTEQETTDFEKALNFVLKSGIKEIFIFGFTSLRTDHSLNNFSVLKRYRNKAEIKFIDDEFIIEFIKKDIKFKYRTGNVISLLPFPSAYGIITKGLKYPLNNESLILGKREGTLNESSGREIRISIKKGDLILFRKHFLDAAK